MKAMRSLALCGLVVASQTHGDALVDVVSEKR